MKHHAGVNISLSVRMRRDEIDLVKDHFDTTEEEALEDMKTVLKEFLYNSMQLRTFVIHKNNIFFELTDEVLDEI